MTPMDQADMMNRPTTTALAERAHLVPQEMRDPKLTPPASWSK